MAKNKQPNGQTFGPKMARALKKRCDELEDAVISQQEEIKALQSELINNNMAHQLMKKRHDDALQYLELNRPEILKLMKTHAAHGVLAAQGKLPTVKVTLVKRKRKPAVPSAPRPQGQAQGVLPETFSAEGSAESEVKQEQNAALAKRSAASSLGERYNLVTRKFEAIQS